MSKISLQIPLEKNEKQDLDAFAKDEGFSSAQHLAKFLFNKVLKRELVISVGSFTVNPHYEDKLININNKLTKKIKEGKVNYHTSSDTLINDLDE